MLNQFLKILFATCLLDLSVSNAATDDLPHEGSKRTKSFQLKPTVWKNVRYLSSQDERLTVLNFYAKKPGEVELYPTDGVGFHGVGFAAWSKTGEKTKTVPRTAAQIVVAKEGEAKSYLSPGLNGTVEGWFGARIEKQASKMIYADHPVSLSVDLGQISEEARWIGFRANLMTYGMSKYEDAERYDGYLIYDVAENKVLDYMKRVERANPFRQDDSLSLDQIIENLRAKS